MVILTIQTTDSMVCGIIKWISEFPHPVQSTTQAGLTEQPYLLSLGMSKALLAFVWIAGPLSGTLVQPYIGVRSDNCRISWGKRKPFMLAGAAATIVTLMALAWVQEIVSGVMGVFGADGESPAVRTTIIVVATLLMYCLDFAINTGTLPCLSLLCPFEVLTD